MANDVSGPVAFRAMEKMGAERVFDPARVVMVADHFMPAKDVKSAELQARLKRWSEEQGVTYYGQGRGGIEHTLLCEEGWIVPGAVIAGGDSHTCTYGALGAFGTGLGSTDIASCLALGSFWQAVPETIQIELSGRAGSFVTGKDVILAVLARDRRRRRDERGARVRRPGRRGALGRRAPRRREHGGRGRLRDGHLPGRRRGGGVPRGSCPDELDGGALRPGRDVPAAARDRPLGARAARRAAAPSRQREGRCRRSARSPSTRSTSATARTGR